MNDNFPMISSDHIPYIDPHVVHIIDWCVMEGGEVIVEALGDGMPFPLFVKGCEVYVGSATCGDRVEVYKDEKYFFPEHVVEIASLVDMGSPLPTDLLNELVAPIQQRIEETIDGHHISVEVADMGEDRCIWVVRRFTLEELESSQFDEMMREHLQLTHEVDDLLH